MRLLWLPIAALVLPASCTPIVSDPKTNVSYHGFYRDQVETFLGLRYALDTGGPNRFKPPRPYVPEAGKSIDATNQGPACPQSLGAGAAPFLLGNITETSEDCLALNVIRPNGTCADDKLPVLVWIHGGSFVVGFKDDPANRPGGLILESIALGHPIIHVELNYRLGVFGFAQSGALQYENSLNAGLRDQRLALEWVKQNIALFGGDPDKVTIHGQSSGGLAIGMQVLAYGASKPAPFRGAICQSQALEPGITANYSRDAMTRVLAATGCNTTGQDSPAAIGCLRALSADQLFEAQNSTYTSSQNVGDIWLPAVDGDFLPAAPSELVKTGRIANVTAMMGWCDDDATVFVDDTIATPNDTRAFFAQYLPAFTPSNLDKLLSLYPISEFPSSHFPNGSLELEGELYRSGRILRDIVFTCQPILLGAALERGGKNVYYYDQNQTILDEIFASFGLYGYGPFHTSEFAYMFGNLSHYDIYDYPFHPSKSDYAHQRSESRSWAAFTALGHPSVAGKGTLQGWKKADFADQNYGVYDIGGPHEGYSGPGGRNSSIAAIKKQRLRERCDFLNSPEIIKQLQY